MSLLFMIGGWQLFTRHRAKAMYGNPKNGSQIAEKSIFVTIADTILEHNKINLIFCDKYNFLWHFQSLKVPFLYTKMETISYEMSPLAPFYNLSVFSILRSLSSFSSSSIYEIPRSIPFSSKTAISPETSPQPLF